jgi:protein-L-isoaspartate(D-aspartate) O-methyltransferase
MDYSVSRRKMVDNQILPNRVTEPLVIAAMNELPREVFLAGPLRGIAYVDEDIPLGNNRYLMEPLVMAQLLQAAEIDGDDIVLDVGCGVGYSAAVIARMASAVVALESDHALAAQATKTLVDLGINTVTVVEGDLRNGYRKQAPYDVIVFDGAIAAVPPPILEQVADGGRIVAVVADGRGPGRGTVFLRCGDTVSQRVAFDAATPYLPGFEPQPAFRF